MRHSKQQPGKMAACTGRILSDITTADMSPELYLVAGASHEEIALVRLYEPEGLNGLLSKRCCPILSTDLAGGTSALPAMYADVSHLITRARELIAPLLQRKSTLLRISRRDMKRVLEMLRGATTISELAKSRFLQ